MQDIRDIDARKEALRKAVAEKEEEIGNLWDKLFNPPKEHLVETPTQRMLHYANTAAGVFDGALLGWKLYRKLNGMLSFRKPKKRR